MDFRKKQGAGTCTEPGNYTQAHRRPKHALLLALPDDFLLTEQLNTANLSFQAAGFLEKNFSSVQIYCMNSFMSLIFG